MDYSVIREFAGTATFSEFLDIIMKNSIDVYVSKAFKLYHYCVIHQADDKYSSAAVAMKEFCSLLLPIKKLHSIQTVETNDFISAVSTVDGVAIVTTEKSIFLKRLVEKQPDFKGDILVIGSKSEISVYSGISDFIDKVPEVQISSLAGVNKFLNAPIYCNVGDTVLTGEQKPVVLSKRISSGAEGMVFSTDNPKIVAKIYHKNIITPLRWSKLTKMVSMGIKSVGICWPQDLLFYKGVPVGYTMFMGKGKTLGNIFDGPDAMMDHFPEWNRVDIVDTLLNLLEKYLYLHMHDIVAGDIQLKNALLYNSNSVYLIDMDSVQVGNLPCPVGTEDFTDPRLWDNNFSGFLRKLKDEDYSIAMLVFSTLFCGLHPYATRNGAETLREEILGKNFPYSIDNSSEEHIPRGGYNYIWQYLPDYLRAMLYNVFKLGKSYEAVEWYSAILNYKEQLNSHAFEDEESYKVFPKMDYHRTENAVNKEQTNSVPVNSTGKPVYKQKFTGLGSAAVYQPLNSDSGVPSGIFNSGNTSSKPASVENKPSSVFVPKANGNTPAPKPVEDSEPDDNNGKNGKGGLFGFFKK